MKLNKDIISKLNPCKDRFDIYLKFYENEEFSKVQFMDLTNIRQSDKLWVAFKLMPKENISLVASDIAESVLHNFEASYPSDKRPRLAIQAARSNDPRAYAAAEAAHYAAQAAGNDSSYTAANAAYMAANAAYTAADPAYATANVVYTAFVASTQNKLKEIVLKYWKD